MFIEELLPQQPSLAPANEVRSLGEAINAAGDTKIELLMRVEAGSTPRLELVEYSWGSGLGWYSRKRLTLDVEQGAGLAAILGTQFAPNAAAERQRCRPAVEQDGNVFRLLFPAE